MVSYCEPDDLLIGLIRTRLPPQISPEEFIENATREMNSKLGFTYAIPFKDPATDTGTDKLPQNQWDLIRDICIKLASGRIILAATSHAQDTSIHAYGLHLVRDAEMSLMAVANGDVRLNWPRVDADGNPLEPTPNPQDTDPMAYIPGGSNDDAFSAVKAFEQNFMTPLGWPYEVETWYPGA